MYVVIYFPIHVAQPSKGALPENNDLPHSNALNPNIMSSLTIAAGTSTFRITQN